MTRPGEQSDKSFKEIGTVINDYLTARDWQDNPSRSLAISIALEANELLEHYQWSSEPVGSRSELASELADIMIYAFQYARKNDIDIAQAMLDKLEITKKKYPAEAFKDKNKSQMHEAWREAKLNHRKEGL